MSRIPSHLMRAMVFTLALLGAVACSDSGVDPEGNARIEVLLTDAPADYLEIAEVCISQIYLQGEDSEEEPDDEAEEDEDDASRVVLWEQEDTPQCFDLLELQGVTASVTDGEVEVPAGTYAQLRLIVASARVVLADPYEFSGGGIEQDLFIPSGAQSGIKVNLLTPVVAESESSTEIVVDAPVDDNFVIQGNPETPAGIMGVLFTPVLNEIEAVE